MASILKVDTIQDQSGNDIINESADTITIGASGDTITVPTGATLTVPNGGLTGQNYPAFEARVSVNQSLSHNTATKVQCADETFDTDGYYDNVTNYRFTPLVAGKYYCYFGLRGFAGGSDPDGVRFMIIKPYKNGSLVRNYNSVDTDPNELRTGVVTASAVIELNGSTDYLEFYATVYAQNLSSTGVQILEGATYFGAHRIGA